MNLPGCEETFAFPRIDYAAGYNQEDMMARALRWLFAAAAAGAAISGSGGASAQTRFALVIGNSNYQAVTPLPNPARDAAAMTNFLKSAGFDVTTLLDLDQAALRRAVQNFAQRLAGKDDERSVALIYFAGHGVQVDGENYLVPVDARIKSEADVALAAVRFADIMNTLEQIGKKSRLIFLDACRDNPFSDGKTPRGLAIVSAPAGSLVVYSTSPGATAEDGAGSNSPFTEALLSAGKTPGQSIEETIKDVRVAVNKQTIGRQIPWDVSSLVEPFSFFPGAEATNAPAQPQSAAVANVSPPPVQVGTGANSSAASGQSGTVAGSSSATDQSAVSTSGSPASEQPATPTPELTADEWRDKLKGVSADEAHDIAVREDRIVVYQVVLELFPQAPFIAELSDIMTRRIEMWAWFDALDLNTVGGYEAFLKLYPNDDLTASAHRLLDRAKLRSLFSEETPGALAAAATSAPSSGSPASGTPAGGPPEVKTVTTEVPVIRTVIKEVPVEKIVTVPAPCRCAAGPGPGAGPVPRGPIASGRPGFHFGGGGGFGRGRF